MKPSILFLLASIFTSFAFGQYYSSYAEQFEFKDKPKQVKLYYLYKNHDGDPFEYWQIAYDYEKNIRTINSYRRKSDKPAIYENWYKPLTQSLSSDSIARQKITGRMHKFDRLLVKEYSTYLDDGTVRVQKEYDNGYQIFIHDPTGQIIETRRYNDKDELIYLYKHSFSNNYNTIHTVVSEANGKIIHSSTITYDEHKNPILSKWADFNDTNFGVPKPYSIYKTEYTYDEYGNFTKSIETVDGELNRITIREITY